MDVVSENVQLLEYRSTHTHTTFSQEGTQNKRGRGRKFIQQSYKCTQCTLLRTNVHNVHCTALTQLP